MAGFSWAEGGFVTAGGARLEVLTSGPPPGEAPTILMLHEGLGSAGLWRDFPARLAETTGCGVAAYSRAGYGRSDPATLPRPVDYMTQEAHLLPEVLSAIGFQTGILFGHSDGATIAAEYTGGVEDFRIRGLILMAPHFFTEPIGLAEIARAKTAFETTDLKDRMARHHKDAEATFRGWNDAWLNPAFHDWNVAEAIDYLRVPVLAIQGRDDQYGSSAQIEELVSRCYAPVDAEILDNCRHAPHQEQPEKTLALITDFVARLLRIEAEVVEIA